MSVVYCSELFSLLYSILLYDYTMICLFIVQLMDIGVFWFGDVFSIAVINILVHIFWCLCVHLCLIYSYELCFCALRCTYIFSFSRYCKNNFQMQFYPNQQRVRVPVAPYPYQHLILSFNINHSGQCGMISYCNFSISMMIN